MGRQACTGQSEKGETEKDRKSTYKHWSGRGEKKRIRRDRKGGKKHRKMDKQVNGPFRRRKREMTIERRSQKLPAPSQLLPWICGQ